QSRDEGIKVAAAGDGRDGQGGKAKREQAGEGGGAGHGNLRWRQADTNAPSGRGNRAGGGARDCRRSVRNAACAVLICHAEGPVGRVNLIFPNKGTCLGWGRGV